MNVDTMALRAGADWGFCNLQLFCTILQQAADRVFSPRCKVGTRSLNGFPRNNKGLTIQAAIGNHQSSSRLLPFLGGVWHFLVSNLPGISL